MNADWTAVVNDYFASKYSYEPWHYEFMRNIGDHATHFHIRVMPDNDQCN